MYEMWGSSYIGETKRHFKTSVNEILFRDKNSHIFKHISVSKGCRRISVIFLDLNKLNK